MDLDTNGPVHIHIHIGSDSEFRADFTALQSKVADMAVDQKTVDDKFSALQASLAGIRADIDALKSSSNVGTPMSQANYDRLSQIADAFATLDSENPSAPKASPSPAA